MKSNNLILDKYKSRGIRGLIVLGIAYFFFMGNYSMIRYFFSGRAREFRYFHNK